MARKISKDEIKECITDFDNQHERCIELGKELKSQITEGINNNILLLTLAEIIKAVREHFMNEESLMLDVRYPEFSQHKSEHAAFLNDLLSLYNRIKGREESATLEDMDYICGWFFMHSNEADARFNTFLGSYA